MKRKLLVFVATFLAHTLRAQGVELAPEREIFFETDYVNILFSGFPEGYGHRVAIFSNGKEADSRGNSGDRDGTASFGRLEPGVYEAKAFLKDSGKEEASLSFSVSTLRLDRENYAVKERITAEFGNFPKKNFRILCTNRYTPDDFFEGVRETEGKREGTFVFPGPQEYESTLELRVFSEKSGEILARRRFYMQRTSLRLEREYAEQYPVKFSYRGFPENGKGRFTISKADAPEVLETALTNGESSGEAFFRGLPPGEYVLQARYEGDEEVKFSEKLEVKAIELSLEGDNREFAESEPVTADLDNLPDRSSGEEETLVSMVRTDGGEEKVHHTVKTKQSYQRDIEFPGAPPGLYEIRVLYEPNGEVRASKQLKVLRPKLATTRPVYSVNELIEVSYENLPKNRDLEIYVVTKGKNSDDYLYEDDVKAESVRGEAAFRGLPEGEYEVILTLDDHDDLVIARHPFQIKEQPIN